MLSSPRALLPLLLCLAAVRAPGAAAGDVTALLAAVGEHARFATPAVATGTLVHRTEAGEVRHDLRLAGRRGTLRIDVGASRALVRHGKAVVRNDAGLDLTDDATIGDTNVRFADLTIVDAKLLENPQIVDEGLSGTVVAAAPAGTSPYALLVVTVDPEGAVVTGVKYYEYSINNLVKRDGRSDFVDVAGARRPERITMWDVQGSGTSEIALTWRAAPDLGRAPFTRAGLAVPLAP